MKYPLIILLVIFFVKDSFSQDLIVTTNKDSIECKIIKIDSIETSIRKTNSTTFDKISNDKISNFTIGYYRNLIDARDSKFYYKRKASFHFGVYHNTFFNYTSRNGIIPSGVILSDMNRTLSYVVGLNYWKRNKNGIGISFDYFTSKSDYLSLKNLYTSNEVLLHEDLKIKILSFNILRRWEFRGRYRNQIIFIPSIDWGFFNATTNEFYWPRYRYQPVEYYKKNLGLGISLAYERNINRHLNIGVKTQYRFSQMYKVYRKMNDLSELEQLTHTERLVLSKFQVGVYLNIF